MFGILIGLALAHTAWAGDCVPVFYRSVPRDGSYYYAAGAGDTVEGARQSAIKALLESSGHTIGHEQDDYARCNGTHYVLVRIEKGRADRARSDIARQNETASLVGRMFSMFSMLTGRLSQTEKKIDELSVAPRGTININVSPEKPAILSPTLLDIYQSELTPALNQSMASIGSGNPTIEDIGRVVATYNTTHDGQGLATFCKDILVNQPPVFSREPGLRLWIIEQCQRGAR